MTDHPTYPQTQTAQKQRGRTSRGIAVLAAVALFSILLEGCLFRTLYTTFGTGHRNNPYDSVRTSTASILVAHTFEHLSIRETMQIMVAATMNNETAMLRNIDYISYDVSLLSEHLHEQWCDTFDLDTRNNEKIIAVVPNSNSIAVFSQLYAANWDSVRIIARRFDRSSGKPLEDIILSQTRWPDPADDISGLRLRVSPDTSKILIYQVDSTNLADSNRFTITYREFDRDLKLLDERTILTEVPASDHKNRMGVMRDLLLDNEGRLYQINFHSPDTIEIVRHDLHDGSKQALQTAYREIDFHYEDYFPRRCDLRVDPDGIVHLSGVTARTKGEPDRIFVGRYDFRSDTAAEILSVPLNNRVMLDDSERGDSEREAMLYDTYLQAVFPGANGDYIFAFEYVYRNSGEYTSGSGEYMIYHSFQEAIWGRITLFCYTATGGLRWIRVIEKIQGINPHYYNVGGVEDGSFVSIVDKSHIDFIYIDRDSVSLLRARVAFDSVGTLSITPLLRFGNDFNYIRGNTLLYPNNELTLHTHERSEYKESILYRIRLPE